MLIAGLTIHKEPKDLGHIRYHSIPIGGYTGVGISVIVHSVANGQTTIDREDISTSS